MTEQELESDFLHLAVQRSIEINQDVTAANRIYDHLHGLKNQLRQLPDKGEAALKRIAAHPDVEVRILAYAALLAVDEPFAIDGLSRIAASDNGLSGFTARMTVQEWQSGTLSEYWN